ncbi:hypothetical protein C0075_25400 [Rhizobium sp. KAs_5_22]|nr:hypothetical protein C0075_25400 [Rhizobium sp. KAs_5_22]
MRLKTAFASKRNSCLLNPQSCGIGEISKMIVFGKTKKMIAFRKEVEAMGFPAFAFSYVSNAAANIEIVPKGINKSIGLAKVAELLKINQNEVLYFGDGEVAIEAIRRHGTAVGL